MSSTMKILYLGNYQEGTGYSYASQNDILALDSVGLQVVPRQLKITGANYKIPERIKQLEGQSDKNCDVCLQRILPHMMYWTPKMKCIGLFAYETSNFKNSFWTRHLNMMDETWVINNQMVDCCLASGVTIPIKVVPHAVDIDKFQKEYPVFELPTDDYLFYFIGEVTKRKNLTAFIEAFHSEFDPREDVSVVIKGSIPGLNETQANELISNKCNEIKHGLNIFANIEKYKSEYIITSRLTDMQICQLHQRCHCFVAPSYGEAWNLGAMDALGFGNSVIVSDNTGFKDYVPEKMRVPCRETSVFGMVGGFSDLYSCGEIWWEISKSGLRKKMRETFENAKTASHLSSNLVGKSIPHKFSYSNVGKIMREALCS